MEADGQNEDSRMEWEANGTDELGTRALCGAMDARERQLMQAQVERPGECASGVGGGSGEWRLLRSVTRVIAWCRPARMHTCMLCQRSLASPDPRWSTAQPPSALRGARQDAVVSAVAAAVAAALAWWRGGIDLTGAHDSRVLSFDFRSTCHSHRRTPASVARSHGDDGERFLCVWLAGWLSPLRLSPGSDCQWSCHLTRMLCPHPVLCSSLCPSVAGCSDAQLAAGGASRATAIGQRANGAAGWLSVCPSRAVTHSAAVGTHAVQWNRVEERGACGSAHTKSSCSVTPPLQPIVSRQPSAVSAAPSSASTQRAAVTPAYHSSVQMNGAHGSDRTRLKHCS